MSLPTAEPKKPLGVRVTTDQHRVIAEAARLEHRSINSFVLQAAMKAAEEAQRRTSLAPRPKRTPSEIEAIARRAQEAVRVANPMGRSLVDELIAERRLEELRG